MCIYINTEYWPEHSFKYALLCNLIKLVSFLRKYAANEQKRF